MRLIIVHHHFRPGGVRRVIEQSAPFLADGRAGAVVLVGGEPPEPGWYEGLVRRLAQVSVPVSWVADRAFAYAAESRLPAAEVRRRVARQLRGIFEGADADGDMVWIHNPGLGRNVVMARELARVCRARGVRVVWHHHDWWFENRWARWAEMRRIRPTSLKDAARSCFPHGEGWMHVGINRRDADRLRRGFPGHAVWLPNPMEYREPRDGPDVTRARSWLTDRLDGDGTSPVWLVPCRFLRRKNMAEAVLLARWIRPEAWLVTTAGASSTDERNTWSRLKAAAAAGDWRVRLSVLDGAGPSAPSVESLLGASEAVVLTSIQEGFGLPFLEAAVAGRPLIGRRLGNVVPDLEGLGLRFPTLYDEVLVSPAWMDWGAEVERQERLFEAWRRGLPRACRGWVRLPAWLHAAAPRGVPFSRLTFTAQLEVLAHPVDATLPRALTLNPWMRRWRDWGVAERLPRISWEEGTLEGLSGTAYAKRFWNAARKAGRTPRSPAATAERVLEGFLRETLSEAYLYPLLWSSET